MKISILNELESIKDFVKMCKKDKDLIGFNVLVSRKKNRSYVMGTTNELYRSKYRLAIAMDWFDPIQKEMITNAISEALYGKTLTPEESASCIISISH